MARYSPTVLPQAFDFGSILDRAAQGYQFGRGLRRERRQERERQEDRSRYLAALKAQQLSQPGASTLSEALDRLNVARLDPAFHPETTDDFRQDPSALRPETLARVGRASERDVPFEFTAPEPTSVKLPSGKTTTFQERAPFLTEMGGVMDPSRARQERTLGAYLDQQMLGRAEPWQPTTRDEQIEFEKDKAKATGLYQQRTRPPAGRDQEPRVPEYGSAFGVLLKQFGRWDEARGGVYLPREATPEWVDAAIKAVQAGRPVPPLPEPELPVAPGIEAGPPRRTLMERFGETMQGAGQGVGRFFGGVRKSLGAAPDEEPSAPARAEPEATAPRTKIPVSQAEYDAIVDEEDEEYAARYFVVRK